jgi:hypothetical protein
MDLPCILQITLKHIYTLDLKTQTYKKPNIHMLIEALFIVAKK